MRLSLPRSRPDRPGLGRRLGSSRLGRLGRPHGTHLRRPVGVLAVVVALAMIAASTYALWPRQDRMRVVAHFREAVGVYPGSDVRILGIPVGTITSVQPTGKSVRVTMRVDREYKVPADAKAVVVSPSVVSDRYVQLAPVYHHGPALHDGASIPVTRTATPVELDKVFRSLDDLDVALGPKGANKNGSLSRLLKVGAKNLDGQGKQLNRTLSDLSQAVQTLSSGRQDLFGTVRNLQTFTTALAQSDGQVRAFNDDLSSVSGQLAGERKNLAAALRNLAVALGQVASFVHENKHALSSDISGLSDVSGVLVKEKKALAEIVDEAPLALGNLNLAYNPKSGTLDTRDNVRQTDDPALYLCSIIQATQSPGQACGDIKKLFGQLSSLQKQGRLPQDLTGLVSPSTSGSGSGGSATGGSSSSSSSSSSGPSEADLQDLASLGGLLGTGS